MIYQRMLRMHDASFLTHGGLSFILFTLQRRSTSCITPGVAGWHLWRRARQTCIVFSGSPWSDTCERTDGFMYHQCFRIKHAFAVFMNFLEGFSYDDKMHLLLC